MTYDKNIHHRRSVRLKNYDYSQNGVYFVTICTKDKECLFGEVRDGKMTLNEAGEKAEEYWKKIEKLHDFVKLGAFVVMPNHIHGIIFIEQNNEDVGASHRHAQEEKRVCQWQTPTNTHSIHKIQLPPKSISSIINHYKGAVKKWGNKNGEESFSWQRNYHEHIIRNEEALQKIHDYIVHNPELWKKDRFFMESRKED